METSIDILVDDCLLQIFDYLDDPLTLANCAEVCSRWEQLLQKRWKQFTMVNLNDPMFCYSKPAVRQKIALIHTKEVETVMRKIGSNLRSVVVGNCYERPVICVWNMHQEFIYRIWGKFDPQDFIRTLPQTCTNLSFLKIESLPKLNVELTAHWVQQLVKNCQDLKVVILRVPLGSVNAASFLTLPRLKYLSLRGVQVFSSISSNVNINSTEFKHLNVLEVRFDSDRLLDYSGLFDVIERMPVLDYFYVLGLPSDEATKLSCKAIEIRVNDRNIIVASGYQSADYAMFVRKNVNPDVYPEPLRLIIRPVGRHYDHSIREFVRTLRGCSLRHQVDYFVLTEGVDESLPSNPMYLLRCKCSNNKTVVHRKLRL